MLCLLAGPVLADPAAEVQRRIDAAGALPSDTRETVLERVLWLREAEGIVEDLLSAGPPTREDMPLVLPDAREERAALRKAAAAAFAPFCEGHEPRECLLAEAEALLAKAPEVDREAERLGAIRLSDAEWRVAILLAKAGHFEDAARIAARIADPFDQARTVRDVVLIHLRSDGPSPAKRLEDVDELIAEISRNPAIIAELATGIAAWLADQGDKEGSVEVLAKAEQVAAFIGDENRKGRVLASVATEFMELGQSDRARVLIDRIEDEFWQASGKKIFAFFLAKAGDFAGAEQVAASIDDGEIETRVEAYTSLAESLAAADQLDEARRVVARIGSAVWQVRALTKVSVVLAKNNQGMADVFFAEADALASGIGDPEDQARATWSLALRSAEAGRFDEADAFAGKLAKTDSSPLRISSVLPDIAQFMWEGGRKDLATRYLGEAERFAALVEETERGADDDKSDRLREIARRYTGFGQYSEAERVAAGIEDATDRVFALEDLAVALVRSGGDRPGRTDDIRRIVALIKGIEGADEWRGSGLLQIAEALAEAGDVAEAEAVAEGIVEPVRRSEAIVGDAIALAEGGQLVEAWRISGQVKDPAWRAVAQAAVAARL